MEILKAIIAALISFLIIIGIAVGFTTIVISVENKHFNNGVCPLCETDFHLREIVGGRYTHYVYECENGHILTCITSHHKGEEN